MRSNNTKLKGDKKDEADSQISDSLTVLMRLLLLKLVIELKDASRLMLTLNF